MNFWPSHPKATIGWFGLFAGALPITVAGEWLGEVVFENRFAASLRSNTNAGSVSWLRVTYGVVAVFALLTAVTAVCVAVAALSQ